MTIDNICIAEYFSLEDTEKYDIYIDHIAPENLLCGRKCNTANLTFDEVQVARSILANPNANDLMELYIMLFRIKGSMQMSEQEMFLRESVFQLFRAARFIREYIEGVNKKETEWLGGNENGILTMLDAGKRLAPFSHLLKKMDIAQMFARTPSEIGRWKYSTIFSILASTQVRADIQKEYNEIK